MKPPSSASTSKSSNKLTNKPTSTTAESESNANHKQILTNDAVNKTVPATTAGQFGNFAGW
jgi:hypothetical protein